MSSADPSSDRYRRLRQQIDALSPAGDESKRRVQWADSSNRVGVARDHLGRIEIFVAGEAFTAESAVVATNLVHNAWLRVDDEQLLANRILLPSAPHFDSVAAFLCTELYDNGVLTDPVGAFRRSEPIIELAITRLRLQGESLVGLMGELILLDRLVERAPSSRKADVLQGWYGFRRSARDFRLGTVGVEAKSTQSTQSIHRVAGVHQVETGHTIDGGFESDFFLVSIGLEQVPLEDDASGAWTLPGLVDSIVGQIEASFLDDGDDVVESFLTNVRLYGSGEGEGYDHVQMRSSDAFLTPWRLSFARAYDMKDDAIKVVRGDDLAPFSMVERKSVRFTIALPEQVTGDLNPTSGLAELVDRITQLAWV